ncbi:MAG: hypothetical protein IJ043_06315 [Clostridia bacterium]|nr:hypothetical protein [Clostridia bacterium]
MKKLLSYGVALLLLVAAIAGAVTLPRRDLRATGQVAGIALDAENGQIKATFELYSPAVDTPIGTARKTIVSTGNSIEECILKARISQGDSLFVDDASALILSSSEHTFLLEKVFEYYSQIKNDQMDLPVFFAFGQKAGTIFSGEGKVLSMELAQSAKSLHKRQTIRDLMNETGERVLIQGEGSYEIIS